MSTSHSAPRLQSHRARVLPLSPRERATMPHFLRSTILALILLVTPVSVASAATPATVSPASATQPQTCPQLRSLIKEVGLPPVFLKIAYRESRCQRTAVGWNYRRGAGPSNCKNAPFSDYLRSCRKYIRSFDSGFWQVNSTWYSVTKAICGKTPQEGALFDARCNARVAKYLYENGGLNHWRASSGS
jgi:hypothetical protein